MLCTNSPTLRQLDTTTFFLPDAFSRTPFGTRFFKPITNPDADTSTFVKRRLNARMWEEIRAWEKLQRTGKDASGLPTAEPLASAGLAVDGAGYPIHFRPGPDVDDPADGEATVASAEDDADHDRLWPDRYSIASDSDIDYILDGFVVIDMADATGSVFWNHSRRRRRKIARAEGSPSLWSRFLSRLRPTGATG
ncbi:hypothetical protein LXA43DRAFT_1131505 [Ganoderma leucocontextum]|nr:hypothetical protein LXA43DRAFT_1131505 [Ganoderma leucocontextum]